eukprot:TRINITY_DN574_c0_g1_i2.p1 TRINITY_DN574_c0_g1~~TRINITY_DN574_c0_g1_i2.p1  ORF type:complete len:468 (-),score=77.12 TRINITY_DN574_c0_g1_i2:178-1581(-)
MGCVCLNEKSSRFSRKFLHETARAVTAVLASRFFIFTPTRSFFSTLLLLPPMSHYNDGGTQPPNPGGIRGYFQSLREYFKPPAEQKDNTPAFIKKRREEEGLPIPFIPPKFKPDDPLARAYLDDHGYVVFEKVADSDQLNTALGLFWDLVELKRPQIKRTDPNTWIDEYWPADTNVGIMAGHGIGQSPFLWYARTLPNVKRAFANVWGSEDLLVSFDGCGVFRPIEHNPEWQTMGGWHHIDQNMRRKQGRHAIQGLLNILPSGPDDGGFVCVPRSPAMMDRTFEKYHDLGNMKSRDYFRVPTDSHFWQEELEAINRSDDNKHDLMSVKIVLDAGDFIMWDSRCIHCSHPPTAPSSHPDAATSLKRLAAYICMVPTDKSSNLAELIKYRVYAFQMGITTSHWPNEFQPSWNLYKEKLQGVGSDHVRLTPEQSELITGREHACDVYDASVAGSLEARTTMFKKIEDMPE